MVLKIYFQVMPRIRVKLFANFREIAKLKEKELEGDTVRVVLKALCEEFPVMKKMLFKGEDLAPFISVFLNGMDVLGSGGLDTPLQENDEIAIFPPVSGG
ncbi:MAG: MoaD/ThiS family protein [Candidatus Methanoperedens sp.]|nr:MoaD/ThiS family protein [Candidatus Methanoperedens sp.]